MARTPWSSSGLPRLSREAGPRCAAARALPRGLGGLGDGRPCPCQRWQVCFRNVLSNILMAWERESRKGGEMSKNTDGPEGKMIQAVSTAQEKKKNNFRSFWGVIEIKTTSIFWT